jgi:FAD/FMN-containing dehydrogenase
MGAYPAYVVNATSPEQISIALRWAKQNSIRVIVKNTGHSYAGRSIGHGSLSIWAHNLRGIEYMENFKTTSCPTKHTMETARIAAGHTGIEVQLAMSKHNRIAVTGANPDVGLVGWLTGGGHGFLTQTYGMGADQLLEAKIVTPNGDILLTNPWNNAELFFAVVEAGRMVLLPKWC